VSGQQCQRAIEALTLDAVSFHGEQADHRHLEQALQIAMIPEHRGFRDALLFNNLLLTYDA
jgi:hypothetical protein